MHCHEQTAGVLVWTGSKGSNVIPMASWDGEERTQQLNSENI